MYSYTLEYFTQNTDFPFFIQYGEHEGDLFIHTHEDFNELTIVLSGTATHVVNNEKYLIKKGDLFVIGDKLAHSFENPHDFKICNIMYRLDSILDSENDITKSAGFHALFVIEPYMIRGGGFQSKLQLSTLQFDMINGTIATMISEYNNREDGWKTTLYANFMNMIVLLSRAYDFSSKNSDNILNVALPIAYIRDHFSENITVEELAKKANMSTRHFTRVFQKIYNASPNNYIIQYRIHCSYALLKNKDLSISEIAYKIGFNDSNYFTRQFKKQTGFTPREYRRFL